MANVNFPDTLVFIAVNPDQNAGIMPKHVRQTLLTLLKRWGTMVRQSKLASKTIVLQNKIISLLRKGYKH